MKTALLILAIIAALLFIANTTITFKPFRITFGSPWMIGVAIFSGLTFTCVSMHYKQYWYQKGLDKGAEIKSEVIEELRQENKNTITDNL